MLEINTNSLAYSVYTHLRKAEAQSTTALERLSSGKRINSGMDDAAGLSISNRLTALSQSIKAAIGNVSDGISMALATEAGMREIDGYLLRTKQLLTQAANDTLSTNAVSGIFNEIEQMMAGISETIAVTQFNGIDLLGNRNVSDGGQLSDWKFEKESSQYVDSAIDKVNFNAIELDFDSDEINRVSVSDTPESDSWGRSSTSASHSSFSDTTMHDTNVRWDSDGYLYFQSDRQDTKWYKSTSATSANIEQLASAPTVNAVLKEIDGSQITGANYDIRVSSSGYVQIRASGLNGSTGWTYLNDANGNPTYSNRFVGTDSAFKTSSPGSTTVTLARSDGWNVYIDTYNLATGRYASSTLVTNTSNDELAKVVADATNTQGLNNQISLGFTYNADEDKYAMGTTGASFRVTKTEKIGGTARELVLDTDYTVSDGSNKITLIGNGVMGAEGDDTDSGFYNVYLSASVDTSISRVTNVTGGGAADRTVYDLDGLINKVDLYGMLSTDTGPMSLKITGTGTVANSSGGAGSSVGLLDSRPTSSTVNGVFVDVVNNSLEFYGSYRPGYNETISVTYFNIDEDGALDGTADSSTGTSGGSVTISDADWLNVDTYNLSTTSTTSDDPIKVLIDNTAVPYSATDGFTFNATTGKISLHGTYRPDPNSDSTITVKWFQDGSVNDLNTFTLPLTGFSEVYNLKDGSNLTPRSLAVFKAGVEIANDATNGYTLEQTSAGVHEVVFHGTSRPNADTSSVSAYYMAEDTYSEVDGVIYVPLSDANKEFVYNFSSSGPQPLRVKVNGAWISYNDAANPADGSGFIYNASQNRLEIYGASRPSVVNASGTLYDNPVVQVFHVLAKNEGSISSGQIAGFEIPLGALDPIDNGDGYGIDLSTGAPSSVVSTSLYVEGKQFNSNVLESIPYSSTNGYQYDPASNTVTLYGDYRPDYNTYDDFKIYTITGDTAAGQDLAISIPSGETLNRVLKSTDGGNSWVAVDLASSNSGNGYEINNGVVTLVGTAKPDADVLKQSSGNYQLKIETFAPPSPVELRTSMPSYLPDEVLEWLPYLKNGVKEDTIEVYLYSTANVNDASVLAGTMNTSLKLDASQWSFDGRFITVDWDSVIAPSSSFTVGVRYKEYEPTDPQDNTFTVMAGTEADDSISYTIKAFENMLKDIYVAPTPGNNDVATWIERIDAATRFSFGESVKIGAVQNRLQYALDSLMVSDENHQAARSRILDADYAVETANLARAQMLAKAGYAMMAQAKNVNAHLVQTLLK